jgi:hypothetical protein
VTAPEAERSEDSDPVESGVDLDNVYSEVIADDDTDLEGFIDADTWTTDDEEEDARPINRVI